MERRGQRNPRGDGIKVTVWTKTDLSQQALCEVVMTLTGMNYGNGYCV